jgi:hypothetical protein
MEAQVRADLTTYEVEVSGWDREQDFFVEKTTLQWIENRSRFVYVRHPISDGAVVFVRVLDGTSADTSFPIAYQVERVMPPDTRGLRRAMLQQLQPRAVRSNLRRISTVASLE